jgi:glycopeptide antibiotics resistance protein
LTKKEAKRVRTLGKILFILYIIFLVYFLFLSDWYGREGVMDEYHYNLELFKEIKRFIQYRHQLGTFAVFSNLFGNILIFMPVGYFSAMSDFLCRVNAADHESGML